MSLSRKRVHFGRIHADELTFAGALSAVDQLVAAGGGFVVTPNVDHVCLAEQSEALVAAYAQASLSLADGMPLLWLARLMGHPLPQKVSGSDLVAPLMAQAAAAGTRVALLGGQQGVGQRAADVLCARHPNLKIVAVLAPDVGFEQRPADNEAVLQALVDSQAQIVLVALGCPKQELWMAAHHQRLRPMVLLGIGATLDFIAGRVARAPQWMSRVGLEWAFRLGQEPRRMAARYLVRDRAIVPIAWRMMRRPRAQRASLSQTGKS